MKYNFKIHREGEGFWAECIELEGCVTEGDTMEELCANIQAALDLYLEDSVDSRQVASQFHAFFVPKVIF